MPFINELIPESAKKTFDFSRFTKWGSVIDVSSPYKTWTIDREHDVVLICRDNGSGPDGQGGSVFGLQWRGAFADLTAQQLWEGRDITWDMASLYLTATQMQQKDTWFTLAHDALMTFGFAGGVSQPGTAPRHTIHVNLKIKLSERP